MTPGWQCGICGFIQNGGAPDYHECDDRSVVRYQLARLEQTFQEFLASPEGKFAVFYARRRLGAST